MTELLYLRDAELRDFEARVVQVDGERVALDRTAFYPTGGGQPHDTGVLTWDGGAAQVVDVRKEAEAVWHAVEGDVPAEGTLVRGEIDWHRRHALMRTHTALHVLCGVIWNEWSVPVTGGNMEPLSARMDFEFDPLPEGFGPRIEALVNAELAADRPIRVDSSPEQKRWRTRTSSARRSTSSPSRSRRSGWSTSSVSTSRPTGAPTWPRPERSVGSGS